MDTENFVIDNGSEGQVIKDVGAVTPHVDGAEFPQAFIIESIHLGDLSALVVSTDQRDSFGVAHFQGHKKQKCFYRMGSSVHEVSHEKVVCVWAFSSNFKQLLQIVELSVNISTNL